MIRPEGSSNEKAEKTISSSWFWLRVMSCVMGKGKPEIFFPIFSLDDP